MVAGIDPKQMATIQEVSSKIRAEMRINHQDHQIELRFTSSTPESEKFLKDFIPEFANTMARMLYQFFAITGTIGSVGKEKKRVEKVRADKPKASEDEGFAKMRNRMGGAK